MRKHRNFLLTFLVIVIAGCAMYAEHQYNVEYGKPGVQQRFVQTVATGPEYYRDVKPIFDQRCVVCHGCYDAPCQLKLTAMEAVDRGANQEKVYDGARLLAASMSRLFVDAQTTEEWRGKNFFPVLNERNQSSDANLANSQLFQLLAQKQKHPKPQTGDFASHFDLRLDRAQQCPKIEELSTYQNDYPLWGMPYALPPIEPERFDTIRQWVADGARAALPGPLSEALQQRVNEWELFFNQDSLKAQLVSRYLYEHLFLASLYFDDVDNSRSFFHLVRSTTPPGEPVQVIPSRRPYDDPGVSKFYYRLVAERETTLAKTHMPYVLNAARRHRWQSLFYGDDYQVTSLPSYLAEEAANPFISFKQLPVDARHHFLLDEARFTIMNFIKGPVCRGQVSLNVINDHFWVFFINPDDESVESVNIKMEGVNETLRLPAESSNASPAAYWFRYAKEHREYLEAKNALLGEMIEKPKAISYDLIWDGEKTNPNAALTIFRHYDSASVEFGLMGDYPKTSWVVGYSLLERIHYLLVAGFDVYGNVGHQLNTRLYMDFLRMEGEANFLAFLPPDYAREESQRWYQGSEENLQSYLSFINIQQRQSNGIKFNTAKPKQEFYQGLMARLGKKIAAPDRAYFDKPRTGFELQLFQLARLRGNNLQYLPENTILRIEKYSGDLQYYSMIVNRAHTNISSLFLEKKNLDPEKNSLSLAEGIYGSYPNVIFKLHESELGDFLEAVKSLDARPATYKVLYERFAIKRSDPKFWLYSDQLHDYYLRRNPVEFGILDYNRLTAE